MSNNQTTLSVLPADPNIYGVGACARLVIIGGIPITVLGGYESADATDLTLLF